MGQTFTEGATQLCWRIPLPFSQVQNFQLSQRQLSQLLSGARLGRRFALLVNPNPLFLFGQRVEEKLVVIIVHVPIARLQARSELVFWIRLPSR